MFGDDVTFGDDPSHLQAQRELGVISSSEKRLSRYGIGLAHAEEYVITRRGTELIGQGLIENDPPPLRHFHGGKIVPLRQSPE